MQETRVPSLGWEEPLETEPATHSYILAWEIPWTEESCGLQFMVAQRIGHNLTTKQQVYVCQLQSPNSSHPTFYFETVVDSQDVTK